MSQIPTYVTAVPNGTEKVNCFFSLYLLSSLFPSHMDTCLAPSLKDLCTPID